MTHRPVVPEAKGELNKFKMEVARDLHLEKQTSEYNNKFNNQYKGNVSAATAGKIGGAGNLGGEMMRRMIKSVEEDMAKK